MDENDILLKAEEKRAKRKITVKKVVLTTAFTVALCVLLFSLFQIINQLIDEHEQSSFKNEMIDEGIQKIVPGQDSMSESGASNDPSQGDTAPVVVDPALLPDITVDFSTLASRYPGIVGWLYRKDEEVHDPVMQATNNDYYLHRLPNGKWNPAGSLFLDYRDSAALAGWNEFIYGHNMLNGSMFGFLHDYRKAGYVTEHPYLFYFTPEKTYRLEVFAAVLTVADSYFYTRPSTDAERESYLSEVRRRSVISTDVAVSAADSLMILSTCAGDINGPERLIVLTKLVPIS